MLKNYLKGLLIGLGILSSLMIGGFLMISAYSAIGNVVSSDPLSVSLMNSIINRLNAIDYDTGNSRVELKGKLHFEDNLTSETCDSSAKGDMLLSGDSIIWCNGTGWSDLSSSTAVSTVLGTESNPGLSCNNILVNGDSSGSDLYWIDPDGSGGNDPIEVYCDMTTDSGGWTLVGYSASNASGLISLSSGGGTRLPDVRTNVSSIAAIPLANVSSEIAYSYSTSSNQTGRLSDYTQVVKVDIPNPSTVNFDATDSGNRGSCVSVDYTVLYGSLSSATRYFYSNALALARSSTNGYGIESHSSSCDNFYAANDIVLFEDGISSSRLWVANGNNGQSGSTAIWLK